MKKRNRRKCNPPEDCFNCPYEDCTQDCGVTKAETEYLKAGLYHIGNREVSVADDYFRRGTVYDKRKIEKLSQ